MESSSRFQLRNWREFFKPDSRFVWRKSIPWGTGMTKVGDRIPGELERRPWQLRELWKRHHIGLDQRKETRKRRTSRA